MTKQCSRCRKWQQSFSQPPFTLNYCPSCKDWNVDLPEDQEWSDQVYHQGAQFGIHATMLLDQVGDVVRVEAPGLRLTGTLIRVGTGLTFSVMTDLVVATFGLADMRSSSPKGCIKLKVQPQPISEVRDAEVS